MFSNNNDIEYYVFIIESINFKLTWDQVCEK